MVVQIAVSGSDKVETMKRLFQWVSALALVSSVIGGLVSAEEPVSTSEELEVHFDSLTVGELKFDDVWVHRQTNAVILIRHSYGIHTIDIADLPTAERVELEKQVGDLAALPEPESGWKTHALVLKLKSLIGGGSSSNNIMVGIIAGLVVLLAAVRVFGKKGSTAA